jgi:hypothetical protein
MLIPVLAAVLAVASPAPAQVTDARLDQIEKLSSNWQTYKAKGGRAWGKLDAYENSKEWHGIMASVWDLVESIEGQEQAALSATLDYVRAHTADPAGRASQEEGLRLIRQIHLLRLYGDILPRVLDEAVTDAQGKSIGRTIAGPAWEQVLTDEEGQAAGKRIGARIGMSEDVYVAVTVPAREKYSREHPLPKRPGVK